MNFKKILLLFTASFIFTACSTDPYIDESKFGSYYYINAVITQGNLNDDGTTKSRNIDIYNIQFLPELAYGSDTDFLVPDAKVRLLHSDQTFIFDYDSSITYRSCYVNTYNYPEDKIKPGEKYRLEVTLPDGNSAYSEIIAPNISFSYIKDTLFIRPDSIVDWDPNTGQPNNVQITFCDSIPYSISEQGKLVIMKGYEAYYYYPNDSTRNSLWFKIDTLNNYLYFSSCVVSPKEFLQTNTLDSITVSLSVKHFMETYNPMGRSDDYPFENIDDMTNINGAYGVFYSEKFTFNKKYFLKVIN